MTASPPSEFPQLGRYQIINKIASGGMAEVFLARAVGAMGFQRLVAVKLIHANFTQDQDFVKMFIDEARIAMHLHHRNIVQVFDLDTIHDTYFIAMEYVHGVNVYDLYEAIAAQNRWVEVPMALYIVAEVCKGLHFAHTRVGPDGRPMNIVHRDISPQNVLLSFEGEVKITDFGIATAAERLHQTAAGIVKGKYAYMAPERLEDKPVDGRVDVFAAGVLLYELLVGENPFAGPSAVETIEAVIGKEVDPPSKKDMGVNPKLDDIVLRALAKQPEERFASAQALADALTEFAMDMTFARKDMASGDSALAQTLAELFPKKAKNPPGATATPDELELPGVPSQPESEPAAPDADSDIDAPTVLRMSPVVPNELDSTSSDQTRLQPSVGRVDYLPDTDDDGLATVAEPEDTTHPTELPAEGGSLDSTMLSSGRGLSFEETEDPGRPTLLDNAGFSLPETPRGPEVRPTQGRAGPIRELVRDPAVMRPPSVVDGSGPPTVGPFVPPASASSPGSPPASRLNLVAAVLGLFALLLAGTAAYVVFQGQAKPGTLVIRSEPTGASVRINGRLQEGRTPLQAEVRGSDPLSIEVSKTGFDAHRESVSLGPGERRELMAELSAQTGSIIVRPQPEQAEVLVNGESRGRGKVLLKGLRFGERVLITVTADGFADQTHAITLSADEPKMVLPVSLQRSRR